MPFINDKLKSYQVNVADEKKEDLNNEGEHRRSRITTVKTRFSFNPSSIKQSLKRAIFGQDQMIEKVSDMLNIVHADITEKDRPLYVAMFLGPTGVGKTETVKIIADSIYGDQEAFSRIDMNTLAQEHYAAAITGAPPGYVGSKEGTTVFNEEKIAGSFSKPGIVLLDEIEKADSSVLQSLLNVFDNGKMVLTNGERVIDFRNSMIFMTSNLGSRQIFEFVDSDIKSKLKRIFYRLIPSNWGKSDNFILQKIVKKQLEKNFSPEFLNRIDDKIIFNWLGPESFNPIVDKLISNLNTRLEKHLCQINLDDSAKEFIVKQGFDKHYGARAMRRQIRKHLEVPLAKILANRQGTTSHILYRVTTDNNKLKIEEA
ncbi:AAA family ATPase [Peribacillus asahii]|uniref:AAA family ATPase n=1 Tax=Peribacillus asahii TaxID=228899 RepID=UPI0037F95E3D